MLYLITTILRKCDITNAILNNNERAQNNNTNNNTDNNNDKHNNNNDNSNDKHDCMSISWSDLNVLCNIIHYRKLYNTILCYVCIYVNTLVCVSLTVSLSLYIYIYIVVYSAGDRA